MLLDLKCLRSWIIGVELLLLVLDQLDYSILHSDLVLALPCVFILK